MSNLTDPTVHEVDEQEVEMLSGASSSSSSSVSPYDSRAPSPRSSLSILAPIFANALAATQAANPEYAFSVTDTPVSKFQIVPYTQGGGIPNGPNSPAFILIYPNDPRRLEEEKAKFDVTEKLVIEFNSRIGHDGDKHRALALIDKMCRMGGLDAIQPGEVVDVPAARMGLCWLANLNDQECKMYALESLLKVLKQDRYHKDTAVQLIALAKKLLKQMDKDAFQAETLEAQIKIAELYNILTENLHHHYGKRHINGIRDKLKDELIDTAKALAHLNRQEDPKLKFHVKCALEGVRRLQDDRQELFILVERIYHAAAAAAALYMNDAQAGFPHIELIFKDIDVHLPNSWYNATLILKNLARDGKKDISKLATAQMLIGKKYKSLNWKFCYAAVNTLFDICMKGETEEIRLRAFNGIKQLGPDFPGLITFANCKSLPTYKDMKAIKHLKRPRTTDPNNRIRQACAECLMELADNAPDEMIRDKARKLLDNRTRDEKDPMVIDTLRQADRSRLSLTGSDFGEPRGS